MEELYRRFHPSLKRHAMRIVGSAEAAEDATQEAFTQTIKAIAGGRQIDSISGWLHTCVHNTAIDLLKERRGRFTIGDDDGTDSTAEQDLHDRARLRNNSRAVLETLTDLTSHQRMAFLLSEVQGFDSEHIAKAMETSTGSVRVLLFKARQNIRESLAIKNAGFAGLVLRNYLGQGHGYHAGAQPGWTIQLKQWLAYKMSFIQQSVSAFFERFDTSIAASASAAVVAGALAATLPVTTDNGGLNQQASAQSADSQNLTGSKAGTLRPSHMPSTASANQGLATSVTDIQLAPQADGDVLTGVAPTSPGTDTSPGDTGGQGPKKKKRKKRPKKPKSGGATLAEVPAVEVDDPQPVEPDPDDETNCDTEVTASSSVSGEPSAEVSAQLADGPSVNSSACAIDPGETTSGSLPAEGGTTPNSEAEPAEPDSPSDPDQSDPDVQAEPAEPAQPNDPIALPETLPL